MSFCFTTFIAVIEDAIKSDVVFGELEFLYWRVSIKNRNQNLKQLVLHKNVGQWK